MQFLNGCCLIKYGYNHGYFWVFIRHKAMRYYSMNDSKNQAIPQLPKKIIARSHCIRAIRLPTCPPGTGMREQEDGDCRTIRKCVCISDYKTALRMSAVLFCISTRSAYCMNVAVTRFERSM